MTKGSGKGLVQLWPSEQDSYARRADGTLIRGLRNDLEALAPCPDAALPLPSHPFSIVIDLTPNARPILLADSPAPKSLLKACAQKLTPKEFFEGEGPLLGDTVIHYLTSPDLPSVLKAEERALNAGASYLAILIRFPDLLISPSRQKKNPLDSGFFRLSKKCKSYSKKVKNRIKYRV